MRATTYEIRACGRLAPQVVADPGQSRLMDLPPETVIRTARVDQAGLQDIIDRLADFALELLEMRQCADVPDDPDREPR